MSESHLRFSGKDPRFSDLFSYNSVQSFGCRNNRHLHRQLLWRKDGWYFVCGKHWGGWALINSFPTLPIVNICRSWYPIIAHSNDTSRCDHSIAMIDVVFAGWKTRGPPQPPEKHRWLLLDGWPWPIQHSTTRSWKRNVRTPLPCSRPVRNLWNLSVSSLFHKFVDQLLRPVARKSSKFATVATRFATTFCDFTSLNLLKFRNLSRTCVATIKCRETTIEPTAS